MDNWKRWDGIKGLPSTTAEAGRLHTEKPENEQCSQLRRQGEELTLAELRPTLLLLLLLLPINGGSERATSHNGKCEPKLVSVLVEWEAPKDVRWWWWEEELAERWQFMSVLKRNRPPSIYKQKKKHSCSQEQDRLQRNNRFHGESNHGSYDDDDDDASFAIRIGRSIHYPCNTIRKWPPPPPPDERRSKTLCRFGDLT